MSPGPVGKYINNKRKMNKEKKLRKHEGKKKEREKDANKT
jgi:hypothetical protein